MVLTTKGFSELRKALEVYAQEQGVGIQDGLLVGLINYSEHLGVRELPEEDVQRVLCTLGRRSIDLAIDHDGSASASGAALANVLYLLGCTDAFGNCSRAAEKILGQTIPIGAFGVTFDLQDQNEDVNLEHQFLGAIE